MLFKDETEKILKACINVHNELGNCFLEPVYQEALSIEFDLLDIPYEKEVKLEISYKGHKLDKIYYAATMPLELMSACLLKPLPPR